MTTIKQRNAQSKGHTRAKPGSKGTGDYFRIVVRPKDLFVTFRNQDVGKPGGLERVAGKRSSGSWATQAWLVSKDDAHVEDGKLIPDSQDAKDLLDDLGSTPQHEKGDIFTAKDRRKKAQTARHKSM